jgi:hypothetical protein
MDPRGMRPRRLDQAHLLLFVAEIVYLEGFLWISGSLPVGTIATDGLPGLIYGPYSHLV